MARRDLPYNHPLRKLTEDEWDELHRLILTDSTKTVEEHCRDKDVSRGRYYRRYPVDAKGKGGGGEASDRQPPTGSDPGNTAEGYPSAGVNARAGLV